MLYCLIDCHVRVSPYAWRTPVPGAAASGQLALEAGPACYGGNSAAAAPPPPPGGTQLQRLTNRRWRARVPLPPSAVAKLKQLLAAQRHPSIEARDELARRHEIDRKRVDKWLEDTRARGAGLA